MHAHFSRRSVSVGWLVRRRCGIAFRFSLTVLAADDVTGDVVIPFLEPLEVNPGKPMVNWGHAQRVDHAEG